MKKLVITTLVLLFSACSSSTQKNIESCIKLGIAKEIAEAECKTKTQLEKKIQRVIFEEIKASSDLLNDARLINKNFEKYTKDKLKLNAEITIDITKINSLNIFEEKVTKKPIFAYKAYIYDKQSTKPSIYVKARNFLHSEKNYEFLTTSFNGIYELKSDMTDNHLFTEFFAECEKTPYCKFSMVGTIDAVKSKKDELSADNEWVGWIEVSDFTFNKFSNADLTEDVIANKITKQIMQPYTNNNLSNKNIRYSREDIKKIIKNFIYKS